MKFAGYALSHMTSVSIRKNLFQKIWSQTHREDGVRQGEGYSQATERGLEHVLSSWSLEGFNLAHSSIADFWPPELGETEFL